MANLVTAAHTMTSHSRQSYVSSKTRIYVSGIYLGSWTSLREARSQSPQLSIICNYFVFCSRLNNRLHTFALHGAGRRWSHSLPPIRHMPSLSRPQRKFALCPWGWGSGWQPSDLHGASPEPEEFFTLLKGKTAFGGRLASRSTAFRGARPESQHSSGQSGRPA